MKNKESLVIILDFDGTCTTHDFPRIGKDIGAAPVLKALTDNGHKIVLFTMRSDGFKKPYGGATGAPGGPYLTEAVNWFKENGIPLYGIQSNPTQKHWTSSPKAHGDVIIDDVALGCPLKINLTLSDKPFVDWSEIEEYCYNRGYIKFTPQVDPKDIDYSKVIVIKKKYE
jgi:hypothetical protein